MAFLLAFLRVAMGPVLLWQGAGVRKNILRMPEPDGDREGCTGEGLPLRLLILGDSSAAGVGVSHQDQALSGQLLENLVGTFEVDWQLLALTGWTTQDAINALSQIEGQKFDVVVICLGVNDITTETGVKTWLETYTRLLEQLSTDHGMRTAFVSGMPPMGGFPSLPQPLRWYLGLQATVHDQALENLTRRRDDTVFVSVEQDLPEEAAAEDGFHPGPLVYQSLGRNFGARIREMAFGGHIASAEDARGEAPPRG